MKNSIDYLKAVFSTFLFIFIGWLLMIPLNWIFINVDLASWALLAIQSIYMILAGILICFIINRKNLSRNVILYRKSRMYYQVLATQVSVWFIVGIVVVVSEFFKLNYFSNFLWTISTIISPENPRSILSIFISVGIYILPFLFITLMGVSYIIMKYIFDKSTIE